MVEKNDWKQMKGWDKSLEEKKYVETNGWNKRLKSLPTVEKGGWKTKKSHSQNREKIDPFGSFVSTSFEHVSESITMLDGH